MNSFSSSTFPFTITNNFCYLNDAKCHLNIFKILTQSVTRAVRMNANVNCYCIICIVQEFQMLSRVCYFMEWRDFSLT